MQAQMGGGAISHAAILAAAQQAATAAIQQATGRSFAGGAPAANLGLGANRQGNFAGLQVVPIFSPVDEVAS